MLVDGFPVCMRDVAEDWLRIGTQAYHWIVGQARKISREPCYAGLAMFMKVS